MKALCPLRKKIWLRIISEIIDREGLATLMKIKFVNMIRSQVPKNVPKNRLYDIYF